MILFHVFQLSDAKMRRMCEEGVVKNGLLSYAYHDTSIKKLQMGVRWLRSVGVERIFFDCGAFSAATRSKRIDLARYEKAIAAIEPDVYAQLDVLGDHAQTMRNLKIMESDGFNPVPIFTRPAPLSELDRMIDDGYDYIALGNLNDFGRVKDLAQLNGYIGDVFKVSRDRARLHMFGVGRVKMLLRFPFYSCDTSEALKATGYGVVRDLRMGTGGSVASYEPHRDVQHLWRYGHLSDFVTSVDPTQGPDSSNRLARLRHNIKNLDKMAAHVTKVWEMRGIEWPDGPPRKTRPEAPAAHS